LHYANIYFEFHTSLRHLMHLSSQHPCLPSFCFILNKTVLQHRPRQPLPQFVIHSPPPFQG
jgi:hypothetical protein